jgi:chromosome segregation ATPase
MAMELDCTLLNTSIPKKDSPTVDTFCRQALEIPAVELLQYNPHELESTISELEGELNKYHRVESTRKAKEYTDELKEEIASLFHRYQDSDKKYRRLEKAIASYNERSWLYRLLNKVSM